MIRDLAEEGSQTNEREADVLIVGAGIAGCITATRLARRGWRVVVVESGGKTQDFNTHPLNAVEQTGQVYSGAEHGRFRCLGGTSTRWGGAMIPPLPHDAGSHRCVWVPDWESSYQRWLTCLPEIERIFGLPPGPYEDRGLFESNHTSGLIARLAKWPPFRLRNVAAALDTELRASTGPEVWLNAHLAAFTLDSAGRLDGAKAQARDGACLQIRARHFVVAAGAIESARLLLLLDRQCDERLFSPDDVLGRYLSDHLSAPIARLEPEDRHAFNRVVGFRFEKGGMRNLRFEMTSETRGEGRLPANFTHIAYEADSEGGFEALRDLYRAIQRGRQPRMNQLLDIMADLPWFVRAAWWRYVRGRLLYPSRGHFVAHLVTEQKPRAENRITLSPKSNDPFGLPLARIHWTIGDEDIDAFRHTAERFFGVWRASALGSLARLDPLPETDWQKAVQNSGGIYHPAGPIRMGTDPANGVVDGDLRAFRIENLHVVSTATLPVVTGANPTLMMMLQACDLGDRLIPGSD